MQEYALILVSTVLVNNFVLVKFLGLCPFMGVSRKLETAMGMGLATTFVLTLSSISSYLVNEYLLQPLGLEYLRTIAFILVIAAVVQFTEMLLPGAGAVRRRARARGRGGRPPAFPGQRHRPDHRRAHVHGLHGLRRPGPRLRRVPPC